MEFPIGEINTPTIYPLRTEMKPLEKQKAPKAQKAPPKDYNPCSCVSYARWKTGINTGSIGVAKNHPINSQIPKENAIVVMNSTYAAGHLAVVTEVGNETITIAEANATPCKVSSRTLSKTDKLIRGYYVQ